MHRPWRLVWYLFVPFSVFVGVSLFLTTLLATEHLRSYAVGAEGASLETEARLALFRVAGLVGSDPHQLRRICQEMSLESERRITLVLPGGEVACDSAVPRTRFDDPGGPPEIAEAFAGRVGRATRRSSTLRRTFLYAAVPLRSQSGVTAVLRVGIPLESVEDWLGTVRRHMLWVAAGMLLLGGLASYLLAHLIARPMERLESAVRRFASGELDAPLPSPRTSELTAIRDALRSMGGQLQEKIASLDAQRRLQQAILAGMAEGVLAIDRDGRLLLHNRAAARMLQFDQDAAVGTPVQDLQGAAALKDFVERALLSVVPTEREIAADPAGERLLLARATSLRDPSGGLDGTLIVLGDASRLRQLEKVRWDFITGVSHELKTPLASIAGRVELALDGIGDQAIAKGHLEQVGSQIDRLSAIIDDLLALARLESETGSGDQQAERVGVCDILHDASAAALREAGSSSLRVEIDCRESHFVRANPVLLSLAVTNLVRNAIRHSVAGGRILLAGRADGSECVILVRDWGSGIARKHLSRIFEPFYRVDSGRSRRYGGSGLGLALVKQIALAHGGTVSVESEPGQGSTFIIRLPTREEGKASAEGPLPSAPA